ncbi:carrier protein ymc1 [Xanthoria parietina]
MGEAVEQQEGGGAKQTFKELFAGAAGGVAQVLIGQPFDIVKVRLQTTTRYTGALDGATQILKHEGPLAFYKGSLTPLVGIGACVSSIFFSETVTRRTSIVVGSQIWKATSLGFIVVSTSVPRYSPFVSFFKQNEL